MSKFWKTAFKSSPPKTEPPIPATTKFVLSLKKGAWFLISGSQRNCAGKFFMLSYIQIKRRVGRNVVRSIGRRIRFHGRGNRLEAFAGRGFGSFCLRSKSRTGKRNN